MGVVGLKGDIVDAYFFQRVQAVAVSEEAGIHALVVVGRRRLGHCVSYAAPGSVFHPDIVRSLQDVGHPAHLSFGVGDFHLRKAH